MMGPGTHPTSAREASTGHYGANTGMAGAAGPLVLAGGCALLVALALASVVGCVLFVLIVAAMG